MADAKKTRKHVSFDPKMAAQVLMDAKVLGSDVAAAKKWGCNERTIRRYRERLMSANDPDLSGEVLRLERDVLHGWSEERTKTLNAAMLRARELMPTVNSLVDIGKFTEAVGGLDTTMMALGLGVKIEGSGAPTEGPRPPAPPSGSREASGGSGSGDQ